MDRSKSSIFTLDIFPLDILKKFLNLKSLKITNAYFNYYQN